MEHGPINKTSESVPRWMSSPETMIETSEVVPDIAACYTVEVDSDAGAYYTIELIPDVGACYTIDELGEYVLYTDFDIASVEDSDGVSSTDNNSDSELSGYEGDHDIEQDEASGNGTDSDVESRIALATKAKIVLQKYSGGVDSISPMPLESLFEEVCDDINDCLGSSYTDEFLSGKEDTKILVSSKGHLEVMDQPNDKENVTPQEWFGKDLKNSRAVKRKLSCDDE